MTYEHDPLWLALETMRIEPAGARLTFVSKLARENGWSMAHARAVDAEYRRFLYLAVKRGPVSPSADVDQAWHLHLGYTRQYWDEMCGRLIGRPLHHEPSQGGAAAAKRFREQYAATLERYQELFRSVPPAQIWPAPDRRATAKSARSDAMNRWSLRRPRARPAFAFPAAGAALTASTAMAATGAHSGSHAFWMVAQGLAAAVALLTLVWLGIWAIARFERGSSGKHRDSKCGSSCGGGHGDDSGCGGGCGGD
jgi:hypothetical protein